jgi:DNA-binding PadR family transcriptional regulator
VLGELEQLVMLAVVRLGNDAYGVAIRREIETRAGRALTVGTVHKTLSRLEDKHLLESTTGEPTPVRGGRRKRLFSVTRSGRVALRESLEVTRRMTRGLRLGWEGR